ncbi:MAG: hypothetical protein IH899_16625 [Planctomycetes bacterium]|nr:hypothetical protein [Planctomycetota bacterium]
MKSPEKSFPYDKLGVSAKRKGANKRTPIPAVSHIHTPTSNRRDLLSLKDVSFKDEDAGRTYD